MRWEGGESILPQAREVVKESWNMSFLSCQKMAGKEKYAIKDGNPLSTILYTKIGQKWRKKWFWNYKWKDEFFETKIRLELREFRSIKM